MRCDQCRHWRAPLAPDGPIYWHDLFGLCKGVTHTNRAEAEVEEKYPELASHGHKVKGGFERWSAYFEGKIKAWPAFVEDSSDYHADLFTKPDFFCACFEEVGQQ